jgi:hypothetical protein
MSVPPWHLTGDGYVWLFRYPPAFVAREGRLAEWQRLSLSDTLGALMAVDYLETTVGPYRELLFIPGRFKVAGRRWFSITSIYVNTEVSQHGGIEHWAIPKALAEIARERQPDGSEVFRAARDGRTFFAARLAAFGPRIPISSALLPLGVAQSRGRDLLITQPKARGWARLCRVHDMRADGVCFPDLRRCRPLLVLAVQGFRMTFPPPQVVPGYFERQAITG